MCFGDSNVAERRHVVAGGERRGRHKEARAWLSDREVKASREGEKDRSAFVPFRSSCPMADGLPTHS